MGPKQKTTPKGLGSSLSSGRAGSSAGSATRGGASAPSEAQMLAELASALRMPGAGGPGASLPSEAQMLAELASALRMPGAGGPGASLPSEAQMLAQLFSALGMPGAGPPGFAAGAAPGGAALPSISANHTTTPQYASAWRQMCALHKQEGKGYLAAFLSTQPDLAALQAAGKDTEALTEATERLCLAAQHHAATQSGPAAIAVLQSALKEAMSSLHLDHAAILELNFSLAHMHQEAGQFEAAWAKWRWVIPRSSRLSGHEWRDGFRVRHLGTQCLRQLGRWGECVPLADEMLKICQSTFSGQYRERKEMDSLNILLLCHQYTPITPPQKVLRYAQLHLEHLRRTDQGGSMAFHMQQDMLVMQQAYREMGDYDAAKKLCKEMVAAAKRAFGVGSEEYVEAVQTQASCLSDSGEHGKSVSALTKVLSTTPASDKSTIYAAISMGEVFIKTKQMDRALQCLSKAWADAKGVLDGDDESYQILLDDYVIALIGAENNVDDWGDKLMDAFDDALARGLPRDKVIALQTRVMGGLARRMGVAEL